MFKKDLEMTISKVTTGGGSMRRGYDTTARRPSTRYSRQLCDCMLTNFTFFFSFVFAFR